MTGLNGPPTRAEVAVLAATCWTAFAAVSSLLLAAAGVHRAAPWLAGTGLAAALALGAVRARRAAPDRTGALLVLGAAVLGAVLFAPAFPYGSSDRDPGVYAYTTYAIARTGSAYVPDPLGDLPPGSAVHPILDEQRVPGLHPRGRTALPGFFLTEPALGATFQRVGGDTARRLMNPFAASLALAALALALRRTAGPAAAVVAVALLAPNMANVWQAKVPGPEMLAQLAVAGALLAATIRWPVLAGLLTTFVWVARPDGLLAVLAGVAFGWRSRRYLLGLALGAPVALWQTYLLNAAYARRNGIPPWPVLLAVVVLVAALAELARRRGLPTAAQLDRAPRVLAVATVAFLGLLVVRQVMAPQPPPLRPGSAPGGYAPFTLARITGLVTAPGIALAVAGVYEVARRRWWLLLAPALLGAPYLVDPRISPDLMFWGRRFVPMLLPGLAILAAVAAARRRAVGYVLVAFAVAVPLTQSWPLRAHREYDGTLDAARVAAEASGGEQAVYLWVRPAVGCCDQPAYLLAGAVWLRYGKASYTVAPNEAEAQARAAAALPQGWPVLVVAEGTAPPFAGLTAVAHHATTLPVWERGGLHRPDRARRVPLELTVWRYSATAP